MPDFPVIDAHVHIYDPERLSYPWMQSEPMLNQAHLAGDFLRAAHPIEIDAMVFVEVDVEQGMHLDEAAYVAEQAVDEPRIKAIVAAAPLHAGNAVEQDLERLAGMPLVRGIRTLIERHTDKPGWSLETGFIDNIRQLSRYNLSFDLCLKHQQLADVIKLVHRCPDVSFVLDHMAKPGICDGLREPWWQEMRMLAEAPNVYCKLSGVVTEADHEHWTANEVMPYVAHALDCFGFDRVMYGGDWPVSRLATDYPGWVAVLDRVVEKASPEEKRKLYRDNAIEFYRLEGV